MAKLPGLFKRCGTYHLRIMVPLDLRGLYSGKSKIIRSLSTAVPFEANRIGLSHRAEALHTFALQRGCTLASPLFPFGVQPHATVIGHGQAKSIPTLRDVHDRWIASGTRSSDSINACFRAVRLLEEFAGSQLPLHVIDRNTGDRFRAWLLQPERGTTTKTARDRFTWVKSLLKYAAQDLELMQSSPWRGLDIEAVSGQTRRPWTAKELQKFFLRPLFTAYELPSDTKAGADAAYWVPLLGLYTGARVGELAQLRPEDVDTEDVPHIRITNEAEGQNVKTAAGLRRVPLHRELIRLGFLAYVANQKKTGALSLWPVLPQREGKPGGYLSQWFGEERRRVGIDGPYPDFHCLRHTVRTQLAEANLSEPLIDALIGHEAKGSTGAKVYTHRSMKTLQKAVNSIKYPVLATLPKLMR
jgi:integrase